MSELKPCPFCGGEAASVPDPNHSTGWDVGCFSGTCEIEPHVWAVHHTTAIDQWNRRADIPPTLSAAMELPEIKALVRQYEMLLEDLTDHGGYTYEDDFGADLAALAAIKETKT